MYNSRVVIFCFFPLQLSLLYSIATILFVVTTVHGRSTGASPQACGETTDIVPNHTGSSPSNTPIPYSVDLTDFTAGQYIPEDTYTSKSSYSYAAFINNSRL